MPKGGARIRSGPAPTSDQRSHKAAASADGWLTLPAEGRDGPMPAFPLKSPSPREMELWERLWEYPQAVAWEQLHQDFEVASYVRLIAVAESPRASAIIWSQVKQFAESLGLSVSGMQRNRWTVAATDAEDDKGEQSGPSRAVTSLNDRLRAVSNG